MRGNLQDAIKLCEENRDFISRDELTELLEETVRNTGFDEMRHASRLE